MRRAHPFLFSIMLMLVLMVPTSAHAQLWSGIIASNRAVDWSAINTGVEGGIPSGTWTQCGSTIAAGASATTINAALAACGSNQFVLLGAGTFNIGGLWVKNNRTALRGSGANQTFLIVSGENPSTSCQIGSFGGAIDICSASASVSTTNWTAAYSLGTTQITLASVSGVSVGTVMVLSQNDDASDGWPATGDIYVCEDPAPNCSNKAGGSDYLVPSSSTHGTAEWVRVTAINQGGCGATCVTISPPVTLPNFRSGQSPTATIYASGNMLSYAGVENLSVDSTALVGAGLKFVRCDNCWMKGVAAIDTNTSGGDVHTVAMIDSFHLEIRDNYIYGDNCPTGCINNYGTMPSWCGSCRYENNIMQGLAGMFVANNGPTSNSVFAYNFSTGIEGVTSNTHDEGDMMNLYEGNVWGGSWTDHTHGTHFLLTWFRNAMIGTKYEPGPGNINATFQFEGNNRFMNVVGNVLGGFSGITGYEANLEPTSTCGSTVIFDLGAAGCNSGTVLTTDTNVKRTLMRWANWDSVTNATRYCSPSDPGFSSAPCSSTSEVPTGIANFSNPDPYPNVGHALPASFYLSAKPSWWPSGKPWPTIGPDVTGGNITSVGGHAYTNPAADCYLTTMGGPTNGSGNPLSNFNAATCYASNSPTVVAPATNLFAKAQ